MVFLRMFASAKERELFQCAWSYRAVLIHMSLLHGTPRLSPMFGHPEIIGEINVCFVAPFVEKNIFQTGVETEYDLPSPSSV